MSFRKDGGQHPRSGNNGASRSCHRVQSIVFGRARPSCHRLWSFVSDCLRSKSIVSDCDRAWSIVPLCWIRPRPIVTNPSGRSTQTSLQKDFPEQPANALPAKVGWSHWDPILGQGRQASMWSSKNKKQLHNKILSDPKTKNSHTFSRNGILSHQKVRFLKLDCLIKSGDCKR